MALHILTKSFFRPFKYLVYHSGKSSNRGVAEVISAIILLGVTVAGGLLVFVLVQNSDALDSVEQEAQLLNPNVVPNLKLTGYDTRDAASLYNLSGLDNFNGSVVNDLCAGDSACTYEYIILKVRNDADSIVDIIGISVNEVEHTFDSLHTGGSLNTSAHGMPGGTLPENGEFIIISGTGTVGIKQESSATLPEASEKRFVISLHDDLANIPLSSNIRVIINSSAESTQQLLIPAGRLA